MSFANYVRKYDVGSIRLDAPYAHFVHELPLLSFGDVLHTINLSLVYQSKMGNNQFNFMPGFGLNLHKRLVTGGTYAHAYMSGNGNSISLLASSTSGISTFKDDSQRIVRKVNGRFIVENPDYSTEEFDENDNIRLVKDKYGNKILEYTYSEGRLISIAYRPESTNKKVNIVYTEAGLPTSISYIVDNATICTTDFVHMENGGIKVQHYSGVDYYVVSSASIFKAYSRDRDVSMDRSYYHSIECTTETDNVSKTIAVINKIGTEIENSITYHFPKFTDDKISVVDVTDYNNTTTRVQFLNDKPAYSYDLLDNPFNTDNELEDGRFLGGVTFYSTL